MTTRNSPERPISEAASRAPGAGWVFDLQHAREFIAARQAFLRELLPDLVARHGLRTALDVGCGVGQFSSFLAGLGLTVTGLDGRAGNVDEARRRHPAIEFHVADAEDPSLVLLGRFDLVLCFGLLYHLENPFRAVRNLHALTDRILLLETIIAPSARAVAALVDECEGEDQGLRHVGWVPSEAAVRRMLALAGFPHVYEVAPLPDYPDFHGRWLRPARRTLLVAAKEPVHNERLVPARASGDLRRVLRARLSGVRERIVDRLPTRALAALRAAKRVLTQALREPVAAVNLAGDRDVEWSWIAARIPEGPGRALKFGPSGSHLGLIAAERGFDVLALDLTEVATPYVHPRLENRRGDLLEAPLPAGSFDLVIACSTVEHVGLVGRYGVTVARPDGDLEAMARLLELMKPGARMLLTVPAGRDAVYAPMCRIYGDKRLPRLVERFEVVEEVFWTKDGRNRWITGSRREVLGLEGFGASSNPLRNFYGLACLALRKP